MIGRPGAFDGTGHASVVEVPLPLSASRAPRASWSSSSAPVARLLDGRTDLLRPLAATLREATADPEANGTSEACDDNKRVMASRSQLLQVVIHIRQMSRHIKISGVLHAFRSFCSAAEARGNPKDIFDEVARLLDDSVISLKHLRVSAPCGMFMHLMMYQDPQLFGSALEAFSTYIIQVDNFFYHLEKAVLLSPTHQQLFRDVRADVDELGHLIYSFENWGVDDQFSTMDNPKIESYQELCAKVRVLCCAGDRDATPKQVQDMFYVTEFVSDVTYVTGTAPWWARPGSARAQAPLCSCCWDRAAPSASSSSRAASSPGRSCRTARPGSAATRRTPR